MRYELERQLVCKLRNENNSFTEIGKIIGLSRHVVRHLYMYNRKHVQKREARNVLYKTRINCIIKRAISLFNISSHKVHATKIKKECNPNVSIRRHLAKIGMRYQNIPRKILLTKAHKERRVEFIKKWIRTNHD